MSSRAAAKAKLSDQTNRPARLLAWYDRHRRRLPWRAEAGERADPYRVWLSEIMLQQTTVRAVGPYFEKFLSRWPDVTALGRASLDDVLRMWAGLGYYSRARNLHACAVAVLSDHGGAFPDTEEGLRALPGIGPYTAAAIAAIAFDRRTMPVDGNIERVVSRLYAIEEALPQAKPLIKEMAATLLGPSRAGDSAQALMDLGATICTPRRPRCMLCPLRQDCSAILSGDPEFYPVKLAKPEKPQRKGAAFVAIRNDGAVLLRKRPEKGLLGGMSEVPTTGWTARIDGATGTDAAPFAANWRPAGSIGHVFTHFGLELAVYRADVDFTAPPQGFFWSRPGWINDEALPTVMKKAIEAAMPGSTQKGPHKRKA